MNHAYELDKEARRDLRLGRSRKTLQTRVAQLRRSRMLLSQRGLGHQMPNRHEIGPKSDPDPKWLTVVWMLTAVVCVCGLIWISFM